MSDQGTGAAQNDTVDSAAEAIERLLGPKPVEAAKAKEEPQPEPEEEPDEPRRGKNPLQLLADAARQEPEPEPEQIQAPVAAPPQSREPEKVTPAPDVATKLAEAEAARNQHLTAVNNLAIQLQGALMGEFPEIKTRDDLYKLGETDPARYNKYQIALARLQDLNAEKAKVETEQRTAHNERFSAWQKAELEKLPDLIPELKDQAKAPAVVAKINAFARANGYSDDLLRNASARDFSILHKAMLADDMIAQQAKAKEKARNAPQVQKPGAAREANTQQDNQKSDFNRLRRTGRLDDAANVFKSILG
jgi:hypothetical protein